MMGTRRLSALGVLALASLVAGEARAQEDGARASGPEDAPWEARLAYRGAFVESSGYAPFSTNDYFAQVSLGASRVLFVRGRFAFAVGAMWDYGSTGATARGVDTHLEMHRLTAPLSMRYTIVRWLDATATIAPGAAYQSASVDEASAPASLVASTWVPAGDASLGVAWCFWSTSLGGVPLLFRATAEGGYAWAARMSLSLSPDLPASDPRLTAPTNLGELAMNGGFGRVGVAVAF